MYVMYQLSAFCFSELTAHVHVIKIAEVWTHILYKIESSWRMFKNVKNIETEALHIRDIGDTDERSRYFLNFRTSAIPRSSCSERSVTSL